MITWLYIGDAFADRLDDTGSLVSEDNGKGTLRIFAGEGIRVCTVRSATIFPFQNSTSQEDDASVLTCVTNSSVVYLNANLMSLWRSNFNGLEAQVFAGLPGHGGFAGNCLNVNLVSA